VVRNGKPLPRIIRKIHNYMASRLMIDNVSDSPKCLDRTLPGNVARKLRHHGTRTSTSSSLGKGKLCFFRLTK